MPADVNVLIRTLSIQLAVKNNNHLQSTMDLIYTNSTRTFKIVGMESRLKELDEKVTMYLLTADISNGMGDLLKRDVRRAKRLALEAHQFCLTDQREEVEYAFWMVNHQISDSLRMINQLTKEEELYGQ